MEAPLPNLKGGNWLSTLIVLRETDVIDCPFVRKIDGRNRDERRRLSSASDNCESSFLPVLTLKALVLGPPLGTAARLLYMSWYGHCRE